MSPAYRARIERFRYSRRILTDEQAERARAMRQRGLSYPSIAAWFSRNGTPISWQTAKRATERAA